jgi:hypothetical protein
VRRLVHLADPPLHCGIQASQRLCDLRRKGNTCKCGLDCL